MHSSESGYRPPVEEKNSFDYKDVPHALVEQFQPQFLAQGGEHAVYTIPGYPDIVIKVATGDMRAIIDSNVAQGYAPDAFPDEAKPKVEERLSKEAARHQQLRDYFGEEHVPLQRRFLLKVPVTPAILDALYNGEQHPAMSEAWSFVLMQQRADDLDGTQVSPVSGYAELEGVSRELYDREMRRLVYLEEARSALRKEDLLQIQPNVHLASFIDRAESDPAFKTAAADFVQKTIRYANETGESLDLAGPDNVYFAQKNGAWNYKLIDALYPDTEAILPRAREIINKCARGEQLDDVHEPNILLNALNFVRTINGLAAYLGMQERIALIPPEAKHAAIDFHSIIYNATHV